MNTKNALATHKKYSCIKNDHIRFNKTTSIVLVMAQKTTAGLMYNFYYDIQRLKAIKAYKKG